jgi:copper chaperone CopZ
MRTSLNAILITLGVLFLGAAIYRGWNNPTIKTTLPRKFEALQIAVGSDGEAHSKVISLNIRGMTCGGCEIQVEHALMKLEGIKKVVVNYKDGSAIVAINPKKVDTQVLIEAVTKAGYSAVQKNP